MRVLEAYIQACRVFLSTHMASYPVLESLGLPQPPEQEKKDKDKGIEKSSVSQEQERRELKHALTAAQESAVVQILLECCLRQQSEMVRTFYWGGERIKVNLTGRIRLLYVSHKCSVIF